ncbi:inversin-like [Acropora muricata]|uniref:inversin-like n=1 Tax=Acropora muricata TaxID=159855 RepID=UPI0034E387E8
MALSEIDEEIHRSLDLPQSCSSQDGVLPTPLHAAAVNGNKKLLQRLLREEEGSLLNRGDQFGRTPLVYSVLGDRLNCADLLLKAGAYVGSCDMDGRTPLHWAAYQGNVKCVKLLLSKGANWNVKDYKGRTPLHFATSHQSSKCLSLLLKRVSKGEADESDNDLMTSLHWSASYGNAEHVKLLLKAGADVTLTDLEKKTPLHWAATNPDPAVVKFILDANPDIINYQDMEGRTAVHLAVAQQNEPAVKALLLNDKCDLSVQDNVKRSPLHWAAVLGNPLLVKLLLDNGADFTTADNNGATAMHYAAQSNDSETVDVFLSHEKKSDIPDNEGRTALMWAAAKGSENALRTMLRHDLDVHAKGNTGGTALHSAAYSGHVGCVQLLIEFGACVDALDQLQHTPLKCACEMGHTEVVRSLILNGATVNLEDQDGRSLLHWAALSGRAPICLALVEQGLAPDTQDHLGRTPLQCVAHGGFVKFMTVLLEHGADVDHQDKEGITALHRSCASGHLEAVKLLLRYKAFPNFTDTARLTPLDYAIMGDHQDVAQYMIEQGGFTINGIQDIAATTIQKCWRGYVFRKGFHKDLLVRHEQMRVKKRACAAEHGKDVELCGNQSPRSPSPREIAGNGFGSSSSHEVGSEQEEERKTSSFSAEEHRDSQDEILFAEDADISKESSKEGLDSMEESGSFSSKSSSRRESTLVNDSDRLKIVCALLLDEEIDLDSTDAFLNAFDSRKHSCEEKVKNLYSGNCKAERARKERERIQLIRRKVNAAIVIQRWFRRWIHSKRKRLEKNLSCNVKNGQEELANEVASLTIQLAWRKHRRIQFEKNVTNDQSSKKIVPHSAPCKPKRNGPGNGVNVYGYSMEEGGRASNTNRRKSSKRRSPYMKSHSSAAAMSYNMAMDLYHPMASRQGNTRAAMVASTARVRPGSMKRTATGWSHDVGFISNIHGHRPGKKDSSCSRCCSSDSVFSPSSSNTSKPS